MRSPMHRATGGPFAALVVHEGRTIAWGANGVTTQLDPTAHAEILAIRAAATASADSI